MPHSMMLPADSDASCDSKDSNQISTQFEAGNPHGHNSAWPSGVGNILTVQTSPGLKPTESPYLFD